ncbi:MAG TPA: hypothetical protein VHL59_06330 [Thermoanaerobaculia bacterium]|nr:hypothetical protein [Thermoanaerobaculia bacterium]
MSMPKRELESLAAGGTLKREPPTAVEIEGLIRSGETRLRDAEIAGLSLASRFDLAYNAAHALSLAALRWHGYRADKRYVVFQALAHTLSLPATQWRILDDAHRRRNVIEYEGFIDVDEALVEGVLRVTREVARRARALTSPDEKR